MRIDPDPDGDRRREIAARRSRGKRRLRRFLVMLLLGLLALTAGPVAVLRWLNPPISAFMLRDLIAAQRDGRADHRLHYRWADLRDISPHVPIAVVAAEDQKFPQHRGFDLASMEAALAAHADGERLRGASTITQQVAKNLFLWSGRSWVRKGLEAWFTLLIEALWSKARILEVYLNIAQFGDGIYGVPAAGEIYFGKTPARITPEEAALLAAVLPNPLRLRVAAPSSYVRQRQAWIRRQMRQLGGSAYLNVR